MSRIEAGRLVSRPLQSPRVKDRVARSICVVSTGCVRV